MPDWIDTMTFI